MPLSREFAWIAPDTSEDTIWGTKKKRKKKKKGGRFVVGRHAAIASVSVLNGKNANIRHVNTRQVRMHLQNSKTTRN